MLWRKRHSLAGFEVGFLHNDLGNFVIPGAVTFSKNDQGLTYAIISSALCNAKIFLQGAHVAEWCPVSEKPVLFLSEKSSFSRGKAIRGGVPLIFPWFGQRASNHISSRTDGPSHGFARTSEWKIVRTAIENDDVCLSLMLEANDTSRELGYDKFRVVYDVVLGQKLKLRLTVENQSDKEIFFEEALHSYFAVGDARQIQIKGLADTEYFDKTDGFKKKRQEENVLSLTAETDRPYVDTTAVVEIHDPVLGRRITVEKQNSKTTVVWNPWSDLTAKLADMDPAGWLQMVCIETANALHNGITLGPGDPHTMLARISVDS